MKRRRAWPRILAGYWFAASLPALAFAQRAPGADFQVNQYTVDAQDAAQISPAPGGGFVAVWESYRQDGSLDGLFGGRFDRLGMPIGREFQINSYTTGNQFGGPVYTDGDGNFVVLWQRFAPTSNLVGRRFDRTGTPLTSEFVVSASATANSPSMARGRDGRFLVAWRAFSGVDGLQARWFDATAAPVGAEFTLKAGVGGGGVVSRPQGGFLGFWSQGGRIDGRLFDDVGNPQGAEFPLATAVTFSQPDSVAVDASGAFVVVWGRGEDLDRDVYMRRFDAGGQPLGAELLVNADTTQFRYNGTAAFLGDGSFVVMWTTGDSVFDVAARQFDASGVPMGPEFVLPAYSGYFQAPGVLQAMPGGHMIATWTTDDLDGSGSASYARLFGVVPMALAVDAIAGQSNGNGVLEPGEAVALSPSWANALRAPLPMSGTLSDFVGPGTATYSILDAAADYGAPPVGSTGA